MKNLAYLSVLTSLIAATAISIDFGVFQLSLFRIIILMMIYVLVIKILLRGGKISLWNKNENSYSIKFMIIWMAYAIISLGWVKDYEGWIRAVYFLCLGVICVVLFSKIFRSGIDILKAFKIMALMVILHNLIGWYEIISRNYLFLSFERVAKYARSNLPVSMFGNTNDFATFMLFAVFITYICAVNSKFPGKIIYYVTLGSSAYLLFMTGSRANILGLILSFIMFAYLSMKNKKGRTAVLLFLAVLFVVLLLTPDTLYNFFMTLNERLYFRFSAQSGSDVTRMNLVKNGLNFLADTFGFGTGAGNIEYWMANYRVYYTGTITNIHNWWAEILTGYGLLIFILYVKFYIGLFLSIYRKYKRSDNKMHLSISLGIMCSMVGFVIGSMSSSSNISSEWLWMFWAVAVAYQGLGNDESTLATSKIELYPI